jgi:TolA-binding protein
MNTTPSTRRPARRRGLLVLLGAISGLACTFPTMAQTDGADKAYRSATGLLNKGMHEMAAEEYRAFLKEHPDHPKATTARYALGVCLSRMGKHAEACAELAKVVGVKDAEFGADAALLLGQSQLLAGDAKGAARTLGAFAREHADHAQADTAACLLGESLLRDNRPDDAAKAFAALAQKWPASPTRVRADLLWAMCEAQTGHDKEAAARLADLRSRAPQGPTLEQATLVEAQCRHRLGEAETALKLYKDAEKLAGPGRADAALGVAQLTRAAGNPKDAGGALEKLLAVKEAAAVHDAARIELARCRLDLNDAAGAQRELAKLPAKLGDRLADDAAYWTACSESRQNHWAEAAALLEGCETKFASSELLPQMLYERADALSKAGQRAEADKALALLRRSFPDHPLASDAALAAAASAYQAGDDATARRLSEEFLRGSPNHAQAPTAALLIAECDYRAGEYARAADGYARFVSTYPKDRNAWHAAVRQGLCLAKLNKADEAAPLLARALEKSPPGADQTLRTAAMVALGDAAVAAARWPDAARWFEPLCADGIPDDIRQDAMLKVGLSHQRQGHAKEAVAWYERLEQAYPAGRHTLQATFERGQALMELGRDDDALKCFDQVVADKDTRFREYALRHKASLALKQGKADEAAKILATLTPDASDAGAASRLRLDQGRVLLAAAKYGDAEKALRAALNGAPAEVEPEIRAQLGVAMARQGKLDEALALLEKALSSPSGAVAGLQESARYERASVLRRLGRDADALVAYQEFLGAKPGERLSAYAQLDVAQLHAKAGRSAESRRAAEAALAIASKNPDAAGVTPHASYLRGLAMHLAGQHAEAVEALAPVVKANADAQLTASAALVSGEAFLKLNRASDAAAMFARALAAATDDDTRSGAMLRLGEAKAAVPDWSGSTESYTEFLAKYPDSPVWFQARFGIAWAAENQGRHDAAIESYRMVTSRHEGPTAARAQFQIGECLYAQKKHDEAVKELLKVDILYSAPEWSAAALYEAGRCLAEQGKTAEARQQFTQVTERFAGTRWAKLAADDLARAAPPRIPGRESTTPASPAPSKERTR